MRRLTSSPTSWKGTCHLVPCGLWLLSCLLHVGSWSHRQGYGAPRSQRAGPGVCRRSAAAGTHHGLSSSRSHLSSEAADVVLQELGGSRAGKRGSVQWLTAVLLLAF